MPNFVILLLLSTASAGVDRPTADYFRSLPKTEFYVGCYWNLRLRHNVCNHNGCFDAEILAHDMQTKLNDFFNENGPPPIEEVQWLLAGGDSEILETFQLCPGLIAAALILQAELVLFTDGHELSYLYFTKYEKMENLLSQDQKDIMYAMFPIEQAKIRYFDLINKATDLMKRVNVTHDFVITRCRNNLDWFRNITVPLNSRLFVYEKCEADLTEIIYLTSVFSQVIQIPYLLDDSDGLMTGECSGYLQHILTTFDDLADFTVFLHDDAPRHLQIPYMQTIGKSMKRGLYQAPFLHLNHERYAEMYTPCLANTFEVIFGEKLTSRLGTYCCGQFVVSRESIHSRDIAFYNRLMSSLRKGWFGFCGTGNTPCYVLEFLWQKVFTDKEVLPLRRNDATLTSFLRYDHGRITRLPSQLDLSLWQSSQSSWNGPVVGN